MKNEYDEIMKKYEEQLLKNNKAAEEYSAKRVANSSNQRLLEKMMCEYTIGYNERMIEANKLRDKAQELRDKIRIREEALDLLIELGLVNENLKQPSIFDKIKSLI